MKKEKLPYKKCLNCPSNTIYATSNSIKCKYYYYDIYYEWSCKIKNEKEEINNDTPNKIYDINNRKGYIGGIKDE